MMGSDWYALSGVDTCEADALIKSIQHRLPVPQHSHLETIGGFVSVTELKGNWQQPCLVSTVDGIGTKLELVCSCEDDYVIGWDVVAVCANDMATSGAYPLSFSNYLSLSRFNHKRLGYFFEGMVAACRFVGADLVGGETAQLTGWYPSDRYDVCGFLLGVIEKAAYRSTAHVRPGHIVLGLASTGPHANGYTLIRSLLTLHSIVSERVVLDDGATLSTALLQPVQMYMPIVHALLKDIVIYSMAHVTGGGLTRAISRLLPSQCSMNGVNMHCWPVVFDYLKWLSGFSLEDMRAVWNCGVGFLIALDEKDVDAAIRLCQEYGVLAYCMGEVCAC